MDLSHCQCKHQRRHRQNSNKHIIWSFKLEEISMPHLISGFSPFDEIESEKHPLVCKTMDNQ